MSHSRVKLPPGVRPPFDVYLNGVLQRLGDDYEVREGALVFDRPLAKEGRLGAVALVPGRLRHRHVPQNDAVDVHYEAGGRPMVAHALDIEPSEGD